MSLGGGGAPEGSSGYIYSFGIHMGIGRGPVDEVCAAQVGGKLAWTGSITESGTAFIDAPNLFGGMKKEGGIQGFFSVLMGEATQAVHAPLAAMCSPTPTPPFRGACTIFYDGMVSAVNPYPKPWSWRVRRALKGWDGDPLDPSTAVITLTGQIVDSSTADKPKGELGMGGGQFMVPYAHGAKTTVVSAVPGQPNVTGINGVRSNEDGSFIYGWTATDNGDGTFDLLLPPKFFYKQVTVNYMTGGSTSTPTYPEGISSFMADDVAAPIFVDNPVPAGSTGHTLLDLHPLDNVGPGPLLTRAPEIIDIDGQQFFRVSFDPNFYGRAMVCRIGFFVGGLPQDQITNFENSDIGTPAIVQAITPPGTAYYATWKVTSTYDPSTNMNPGDFTAVTYPYSEEGIGDEPNIGLVGIKSIEAEGTLVAVSLYYYLATAPTAEFDATIKAMNGAHIIYECLTNRAWGRGLDRSLIDTPSFIYAAETLFDEDFGLCMRWNRRDSISGLIQSVLDHIGATLYADRTTALLKLKLIRGDYDRGSLPLFDTSNGILSITDSAVNSSAVVINEIIVKWHDPIYDEDRSVNEQNLASLISSNGAFNTLTKSYLGLPTASLARRVALRDLKAQAEGLRKFKLVMDRRAWKITPGDVFRMQDGPRNIPDMVVRVARVEDGVLLDGKITLDVVQDVFSFPARSFTEDQPNTWVPPKLTPCIGDHQLIELPYFMLVRALTAAELDKVSPESSYLGVVAEPGQPQNVNYDIAVRDSPVDNSEDQPDGEDQLYCGYQP